MTQAELVTVVARKTYATKKATLNEMRRLFEEIATRVLRGETIRIADFGTFYLKRVRSKRVISPPGTPSEGEIVTTLPLETIGFRAAKKQRRRRSTQ